MKFWFERNDLRRRVTVTLSGGFRIDEALAILDRCRHEDVGRYSILYNAQGLTTVPTVADARQYLTAEMSVLGTDSRGPIAIVVSDPTTYNVACSYAALGRGRLNVEVFRDRGDAEAWLTSHATRPPMQ
jgi:hypothetical protein